VVIGEKDTLYVPGEYAEKEINYRQQAAA